MPRSFTWVTLALGFFPGGMMYSKRILVVVFLLLSSCGTDKQAAVPAGSTTQCSSSYNGSWNGNTGGTAVLGTDCTLSLSLTGACTSTGTYEPMLGSFGTTEVTVTGLSGTSPCLSLGTHRCSYVFSGSQFSLNCGSGDYIYYR